MNRIEFGMPTLLELESLTDCASLARELGLDFVEINMNMPEYQIENLTADALKRVSEGDLYFTFHLDENFNPADFNRGVAKAYLETARETIRLARAVRAPVVNMHMAEGIAFKLPDRRAYLFEKYRDRYMSSLAEFREICESEAGDDVLICVENTGGYQKFMREGVEFLLERGCFGLTLDIGHSHAAGGVDEAFIREHAARLAHMHVHDVLGENCHLVLGCGEIDLKERLALAEAAGCRCVVETKSVKGLRESVAWLKDKGYFRT